MLAAGREAQSPDIQVVSLLCWSCVLFPVISKPEIKDSLKPESACWLQKEVVSK